MYIRFRVSVRIKLGFRFFRVLGSRLAYVKSRACGSKTVQAVDRVSQAGSQSVSWVFT